jgi:hypothetical protein
MWRCHRCFLSPRQLPNDSHWHRWSFNVKISPYGGSAITAHLFCCHSQHQLIALRTHWRGGGAAAAAVVTDSAAWGAVVGLAGPAGGAHPVERLPAGQEAQWGVKQGKGQHGGAQAQQRAAWGYNHRLSLPLTEKIESLTENPFHA